VVSRSDDHGENWRIGSKQVQPYHTTECSVAQSYDGTGDLYLLRAHTEQISSAGLSFNLPLNLDLNRFLKRIDLGARVLKRIFTSFVWAV
jgi:hypothetical protein